MNLTWLCPSWPKFIKIGRLYHIADIEPIGQKSTFNMKKFFVF